jgi:hypothetical protein
LNTITQDFIIPLRHPDNMRDRTGAIAILRQTVRSALAQDGGGARVLLVSNPMDELAEFDADCIIVPVDLPPNAAHDVDKRSGDRLFFDAVRRDKGQRLKAGLDASDAAYVMLLDDDDFVYRGLTRFVANQDHPDGWYVDKGYHWTTGTGFLFPQNRFYQNCGSCYVLRRALLHQAIDSFDDPLEGADKMLGSHLELIARCKALGRPLAPLPFRAAIKRRGHANAHSQTGSIDWAKFLRNAVRTAARSSVGDGLALVRGVARYEGKMDAFTLPPRG